VLLDIPPLDPKLPTSIEASVDALCRCLRARAADSERGDAGGPADLRLLRNSGLLSLVVPAQFGGKGASWGTSLDIVRRVARADSAVAERLAGQYLQLGTVQLLGDAEQQGELLFGSAQGDWLWGSALHRANNQVRASVVSGGVEITGVPGGHQGTADADRLLLSAQMADGSGMVIAAVDAGRPGILRQIERNPSAGEDAPRIEFRKLALCTEEILGGVHAGVSVRASLRPLLEQLGLVHLFLGLSQGALDDLVLASQAVPRLALNGRNDDHGEVAPMMLQRYADLWVDMKAASTLTRSATRAFEDAWSEGDALRATERARLALEIGEARTLAGRAGLQLTQVVFEAMSGAHHVPAARLNRWWRRLRTHNLHDPVDFKRREIGRWILTGDLPRASLFA